MEERRDFLPLLATTIIDPVTARPKPPPPKLGKRTRTRRYPNLLAARHLASRFTDNPDPPPLRFHAKTKNP